MKTVIPVTPPRITPQVYAKEATKLAFRNAPQIFACSKCKYPMLTGKSCGFCGNNPYAAVIAEQIKEAVR